MAFPNSKRRTGSDDADVVSRVVEELRARNKRQVRNLDNLVALLVLAVIGLGFVPDLGVLRWIIGAICCFAVFILAILLLSKGAVFRGLGGLSLSLFVLPFILTVLPFVIANRSQFAAKKETIMKFVQLAKLKAQDPQRYLSEGGDALAKEFLARILQVKPLPPGAMEEDAEGSPIQTEAGMSPGIETPVDGIAIIGVKLSPRKNEQGVNGWETRIAWKNNTPYHVRDLKAVITVFSGGDQLSESEATIYSGLPVNPGYTYTDPEGEGEPVKSFSGDWRTPTRAVVKLTQAYR